MVVTAGAWRLWSVDTTLANPVEAGDRDGVALAEARRVKGRTYPELVGFDPRPQLVLAHEVRGRWSEEAKIRLLAIARARSEP